MVRKTEHHQFDVPEPADDDYDETFDSLIDDIDVEVLLKGTIGNRPQPGLEGRWYLSTDESPPTIYYDTGTEWVSPATFGDPPSNIARRDREETFTEPVTFDEPIHADITGSAETASEAGEAHEAANAQRFEGHPADDFVRTDRDNTFDGVVEFNEPPQFAGFDLVGGTLSLARYSGSDPTNAAGDIWFRSDRQP